MCARVCPLATEYCRTIGEGNLHALLLQLHCAQVQLSSNRILRSFDSGVDQVRVQGFAIFARERRARPTGKMRIATKS